MRKLLVLFCIGFIFFFSPIVPFLAKQTVLAASSTNLDYVDGDYAKSLDKAKGPTKDINGAGHMSSSDNYLMSNKIRSIVPITGLTTETSLNDPKTKNAFMQLYNESFAGYSDKALAYLYNNPPASTYAFIEDMGQSLGFIPKRTYAQGIGFNKLDSLLPLWKAFRNIAYALLAVAMIIIGFLIMFRKKIDPKTVITVQNALPNIVITLLLITFSYAIVGVLIDFMYVIIAFAISILKPVGNGVIDDYTYQTFLSGSYDDVARKLLSGGQEATFQMIVGNLLSFFGLRFPTVNEALVIAAGMPIFISILPTAGLVASAGTILLAFILCLVFLFATVRLFFVLISAYIQIIMSLLISPFQLLLGVFPGSNAFENWIKNLIANLAVFPITAIMILIGSIIVKYGQNGTVWAPPMLTSGDVGAHNIVGVIAIGILLGIPSVVNSVKEALKAKPAMQGGMGIGGMISSPITMGTQVLNTAYQWKTITGNNIFGMFGLGGKGGSNQQSPPSH